jgi:hypothetical protein
MQFDRDPYFVSAGCLFYLPPEVGGRRPLPGATISAGSSEDDVALGPHRHVAPDYGWVFHEGE